MPRLPDWVIKPTIFLYKSANDARNNKPEGGSGFLLGFRFPKEIDDKKSHVYAVTNSHVIVNFPVIRINKKIGGLEVIELNKDDWKQHYTRDDVAIAYLGTEIEQWDAFMIMADAILTPQLANEHNIGLGTDVFVPSRLIHHEGNEKNHPILRFGTIASIGMQPVWNPMTEVDQETIFVECRSIPGHSGSPVIAVEGNLSDINKTTSPETVGNLWLLGVTWGYMSDKYEMNDKTTTTNTGIMGVVPAWKLHDLLLDDEIVEQRKVKEQEIITTDRSNQNNNTKC